METGEGHVASHPVATPDMHAIHNRMPVTLEKGAWDRWLGPEVEDRDELEGMLQPSPAGTLEHYPVSKEVGNVANDGAELLEVRSHEGLTRRD